MWVLATIDYGYRKKWLPHVELFPNLALPAATP